MVSSLRLTCLCLLVGLSVLFTCRASAQSGKTPDLTAGPKADGADPKVFKPGERTRLYLSSDNGAVPLLAHENAYREFLSRIKAREPLEEYPRFYVPRGEVEVIAMHDGTTYPLRVPAVEIKILVGPMSGETYWTAEQYVRHPVYPKPEGEVELPAFAFNRDTDYELKIGEQVTLYNKNGEYVIVAADMFALDNFIKFGKAGDETGLADQIKKGRLGLLENYSVVLAVKRHKNPFIAEGLPVFEGRIIGGENKDKLVWILEEFAAQFRVVLEYGKPKPAPISPANQAEAAAKRAETLVRSARNLERLDKIKGALDTYRRIVKEFPGTPQAKAAATRIKALGGK